MSAQQTIAAPGPQELTLPGNGLLRFALKLDAAVSAANAAAYLILAGPLSDLLGIPASFLRAVGAFFVIYAAFVWATSRREEIPRGAVLAIIDANIIWVIASFTALATGFHDPTTAGSVWIALQAITVAGFAALQFTALRRRR